MTPDEIRSLPDWPKVERVPVTCPHCRQVFDFATARDVRMGRIHQVLDTTTWEDYRAGLRTALVSACTRVPT